MKASGLERVERCQFNLLRGPSDAWFDKFQERHFQLTWKIPQSIDSTRITQATDYIVDDFFNKYGTICFLTFTLINDQFNIHNTIHRCESFTTFISNRCLIFCTKENDCLN